MSLQELLELAKSADGRQKIRWMVAELCGFDMEAIEWQKGKAFAPARLAGYTKKELRQSGVREPVPDYANSLDAMLEAIRHCPDLDLDRWAQWLYLIVQEVNINECDRLKDFLGELDRIDRWQVAKLLNSHAWQWAVALVFIKHYE